MLRAGNSALTENKAHSSYLSAAGSAHVTRVGNMAQTREEDETSQVNNSNRKQKLDQLRRIQEEKKKSGTGGWISADFLSPDNTPRMCLSYSFPQVE